MGTEAGPRWNGNFEKVKPRWKAGDSPPRSRGALGKRPPFPGCSLSSLAGRSGNKLALARGPSTGIMHDKLGLFDCKSTGEKWVLAASWNFTAGAGSQQWNILLQAQNDALHAACSSELAQMLRRNRFHDAADKARFDAPFRTALAHAPGLVRFAPYASSAAGGPNALTEITNRIAHATSSIWFALNKQTRPAVTDQLIAAADRGVEVHGVIPASDRDATNKASYAQYRRLPDRSEYATANRVRMHDAYDSSARTSRDSGRTDLVHCKYMVIDPGTAEPWVIHGSANWTATALSATPAANVNDETVLFLPDAGIAYAFLRQFSAMTGVSVPEPVPASGDGIELVLSGRTISCNVPDDASGRSCALVGTTDPATWTADWSYPLPAGCLTLLPVTVAADAFDHLLFRIEGGR